MQLGISTASYFTKMTTEDAIVDIADHRVPLCELFLNSFSEYRGEIFDCILERIHQTKLPVYSIHPMSTQFEPQLFSIHPRQRGDAWKIYELVLQSAKAVGAKHYIMHGAAHLSGAAKNLQMERLVPIFRDLCAMAKGYGVQLTLENVSWCIFCRPEFGSELQQRLGSDSLKYTLDIKQALRSGYAPIDFVHAVGSDIVNLHLCDAIQTEKGLRLKMPGDGTFDYAALLKALQTYGYNGPAFVEVYSDMYAAIPDLYASYQKIAPLFL